MLQRNTLRSWTAEEDWFPLLIRPIDTLLIIVDLCVELSSLFNLLFIDFGLPSSAIPGKILEEFQSTATTGEMIGMTCSQGGSSFKLPIGLRPGGVWNRVVWQCREKGGLSTEGLIARFCRNLFWSIGIASEYRLNLSMIVRHLNPREYCKEPIRPTLFV